MWLKSLTWVRSAALVAASAAAMFAASPAGALPAVPLAPSPDCDWKVFATDSDIDQQNGTVVHIAWGTSGGVASYKSNRWGWDGPLSGPIVITGTNELDFSVAFSVASGPFGDDPRPAAPTNRYTGFIDANGAANGTWSNNSGVTGRWTMGPTFKCIGKAAVSNAPAPPPPPPPPPPVEMPPSDAIRMVISQQGLRILVTVTSTADIPGQCTYDATEANNLWPPVNESFDITPRGTKELTFPAPLPVQSWRVVVACRGNFNGQNVEFGRQVQNL